MAESSSVQPAKRRRRPGRLLQQKRIPVQCQGIYEKNATDSPLLVLPPEMHNRIWGHVLAGPIVHVEVYGHAVVHSLCECDESDADIAQRIENSKGESIYSDNAVVHDVCNFEHPKSNKKTLDFNLLRVSRQIHREAALLPYENNTFAFSDACALAKFVRIIMPVQVRTIKSITISTFLSTISGFPPLSPFGKSTKLIGVKRLVCFVPFYGSNALPPFDCESLLRCWLDVFQRLPLKSVRVVAYNAQRSAVSERASGRAPYQVSHPCRELPYKVLRAWAERVEQELLKDGAELDKREQEEAEME